MSNPEHTWRTYDRYQRGDTLEPRQAQVMRTIDGSYITRIIDENGIVVAAPRVTSYAAGKAAMESITLDRIIPHE